FGRAAANALLLDNTSLADTAGSFVLAGRQVRFVAAPGAGVTHDGRAVSSLDLTSDAQGEPTVLASGSLRFFVIERAGNLGVRVRDSLKARLGDPRGPPWEVGEPDWVCNARFEPYEPT